MTGKVTVIGGIPKPIGGVTTFIFRLVTAWPSRIKKVVDLYPAAGKNQIPVTHEVFSHGKLTRLFLNFLFSIRGPVYFNFSGARGLALLGVLPKIGKSTWGLTLHNGELEQEKTRGILIRALMKIGLRKCNLFGVLSEKQKKFYFTMGVDEKRILRISSFIPQDFSRIPCISSVDLPEINLWKQEGLSIFVISGYPTSIYQHEDVLRIFQRLWESGQKNIRLAAFLYGSDEEKLLSRLRKSFDTAPFAQLYWDKSESTFLAGLKASTAYIRMNTVDSYGVAVAEAITLGKPVIASDVCDRFEGAQLIKSNDWVGLESFIIDISSIGNPLNVREQNTTSECASLVRFLDLLSEKKGLPK